MPNSDMAAGQARIARHLTPEELAEFEAAQAFNRCERWRRRIAAEVEAAERCGVVVTVERVSVPPLAMGNHIAVITTREKR